MMGFSRPQNIAFWVMVAAIMIAPAILYPVFLMKVMCFALFACAFNLLIGYVGLGSFGHAAFFGMGAYITAHTAKVWGLTPELAILAGGTVAAGLGLIFGWLAIRRQGIYFAMITLALAQMNYFLCTQWDFTGGEDGIQGVPRGYLFGIFSLKSDLAMYGVVAVIFVAGFLLIHRIVHSPFGQVLKAIRENEPRATSLGYRVDDYKLMVFVLSAAIAGIAGGLKSLVFGIATLTDVNFPMSGEVILMALLGGMGTIFGPVVGAAIVIAMQNYLAPFGAWVTVTQGVVFVVCVLAFRRGLVGELAARRRLSL
jgi:branched-chain amino acid transport system permease protein